jgi:HAD superfamily hydrolase (TIGR01509 family)
MPNAVLFDIDGTLIDSVDFHAESWQRTFEKFGKEIPFERIRQQIGKGSDLLLPVFWTDEELERLEAPMSEYRSALFEREYMPRIRPFPRVRELFQRIRGDGLRIVLASSADADQLRVFKDIAGIADLLDDDVSSGEVERSKPNPDIFEVALAKAGIRDPREAIAVGDTPYDAEAARKAGTCTIGVLCGGFPEAELRQAGCTSIYRDPADLLEHYVDSPLVRQTQVSVSLMSFRAALKRG